MVRTLIFILLNPIFGIRIGAGDPLVRPRKSSELERGLISKRSRRFIRWMVLQFQVLVHIRGSTPNSDEVWMRQISRNLTDCEAGFVLLGPSNVSQLPKGS